MSAAESTPTPAERAFDPQARELVRRLVGIFGIQRTRELLWEAVRYLKHEYGGDA